MYVGNSVQGIREAGLQLYSVADGCFGSWGTAELCPCMAALQPTARQLWACTLQSDAVFVCLSELPKWSGRPWSTRLLTARWYSPSTGWRPCWSARDFWWVFLIGSLTAVSLHLISMQNTPSGYDVFWIDEGHSGQLSNLPTGLNCSRHLFAISPDLSDTSAQTSWVVLEEQEGKFQPEGKLCRLSSCWSRCFIFLIGSGDSEKSQHLPEFYNCKCRISCTWAIGGCWGRGLS